MTTYVCQTLVTSNGDGVLPPGVQYCQTWVESTNLLDTLAITPAQAGAITAAICTLLATGYLFGELASFIRNMGK